MVARLRQGLFGPYFDDLASDLTQQRYSAETIRRSLSAAGRFCDWLSERRLGLGDAQEATIGLYLDLLRRSPSGAEQLYALRGLHHAVRFLRQRGLVEVTVPPRLEMTPAERWLGCFEQHNQQVAGSSKSTC